MKLYSTIAGAFLALGLFFAVMEFIYGYHYHVWDQIFFSLSHPGVQLHGSNLTKVPETILFGFLTFACLLISIASGVMAMITKKK